MNRGDKKILALMHKARKNWAKMTDREKVERIKRATFTPEEYRQVIDEAREFRMSMTRHIYSDHTPNVGEVIINGQNKT